MAVDKKTYQKKCKLIFEAYCDKWGEGLRDEIIFEELHSKFHLQPKTLENIVRKMRKESQDAQVEIPFNDEGVNLEGGNNEAE
jgi:hypothetical protein